MGRMDFTGACRLLFCSNVITLLATGLLLKLRIDSNMITLFATGLLLKLRIDSKVMTLVTTAAEAQDR